MSVNQEADLAVYKFTQKSINLKIPTMMSTQIKLNTRNVSLIERRILDTKPSYLTENLTARLSLRARLYKYNTLPKKLTQLTDIKRFSKWIKKYMKDKNNFPTK